MFCLDKIYNRKNLEHHNTPELKETLRDVMHLAVYYYTIDEINGTGKKWMANISCDISDTECIENFIHNITDKSY